MLNAPQIIEYFIALTRYGQNKQIQSLNGIKNMTRKFPIRFGSAKGPSLCASS